MVLGTRGRYAGRRQRSDGGELLISYSLYLSPSTNNGARDREKQKRRVCGAVSPDLSLQVHSRVFDLAVKPACVLFGESPKGRESVLSTRPTSEAKQYVDSWTPSSDRPSLFQST